ncbi:MAG: ASPIC/UnbV domain-containing protein, partial [Bryobacteraceae bacterium]
PTPLVARGMAYGDYDRDGDLDVLIATNNGPAHLYRNDGGNANHWLNVKLEGTRCNRDGIGAVVRVTSAQGTQWQAVHSGSSFCSASDLALTFGLGRDKKATSVEVQWPAGTTQILKDVPAGQHLVIQQQ